MFRLWAKKFKDNRMLDDITITDQSKERTGRRKYSTV